MGTFWVLAALGICLTATGAAMGQYFPCGWGMFLVWSALLGLRGKSWGFAGQLRRQYDASNLREAGFTWRSFIKRVRTPTGLMLHTHPAIFHWLPRRAFATGSEFEALAATAREQITAYRDLH